MDKFKLQIFKKENPDKILSFTTLNSEDSKWVISDILRLSHVSNVVSDTQLFYQTVSEPLKKEILSNGDVSPELLQPIFDSVGILNDSLCFIFWDYDEGIDLFTVQNLLKNWEYIWYDTSDEAIVLYFPASAKLILVTDQGFIKTN